MRGSISFRLGVFFAGIILPLFISLLYFVMSIKKNFEDLDYIHRAHYGIYVFKSYQERIVDLLDHTVLKDKELIIDTSSYKPLTFESVVKTSGNKEIKVSDYAEAIGLNIKEMQNSESVIFKYNKQTIVNFMDVAFENIVKIGTQSGLLYDPDAVRFLFIDSSMQKMPQLVHLIFNLKKMILSKDTLGTKVVNINSSLKRIKFHLKIAMDSDSSISDKTNKLIVDLDSIIKLIDNNKEHLIEHDEQGLLIVTQSLKSIADIWTKMNQIISERIDEDDVKALQEKKKNLAICFVLFAIIIGSLCYVLNFVIRKPFSCFLKEIEKVKNNSDLRVQFSNSIEFEKISSVLNDLLNMIKQTTQEANERMLKTQKILLEEQSLLAENLRSDISKVFGAAVKGDLTKRLTLDDKAEHQLSVCEDINSFMNNLENIIMEFNELLSVMSNGNLTKHINIELEGIFNELKNNANLTVEQLRNMIQDIVVTAQTLEAASQSMADSSAELSEQSESQACSLEETAAGMEEFSATVIQTTENANTVAQLAKASKDSVVKGSEVAMQAKESMSAIEQSSREIIKIIDVIDDITFQTNLLALNASIEAARAGEAGKGFAVVAEEVRNLARNSGESAKQIKDLITGSNARVKHGAKLVEATGYTMNEVLGFVEQVAQRVESIARSTEEQCSGIDSINSAMNRLDTGTQNNSALSQESRALADNLKLEANKILDLLKGFRV